MLYTARVDETLAIRCDEVLRAHPALAISRFEFRAFVAARPGAVHLPDLLLACAALRGSRAAHEALELDFFSALPRILARLRLSAEDVSELGQRLRVSLLVGNPDGAPKLASYAGSGPLAGWLRAVATRAALSELRRLPRDREHGDFDSQMMGFATQADDAMRSLHQAHASQLEAAMRAALAELGSRDRNVLRMYVVDGANIDAIGAVYQVHRATIARWIAEIRIRLADRTRALLDLTFSPSEVRSIAALCFSQLDLSLERLLLDATGARPSPESLHREPLRDGSAHR